MVKPDSYAVGSLIFQGTMIRPIPTKSRIVLTRRLESSILHVSMKYPLRVAQCFGLFPIDLDITPLEFRWIYWRVAYSSITFLIFCIEFCLVAYKTGQFKFTFTSITTLVFHYATVIEFGLFLHLAYQWPRFVKEWSKVEVNMNKNYEIRSNLRSRMFWLTTSLLVFAFVEHFLVNASRLMICFETQPTTPSEAFREFFTDTYKHFFGVVAYSIWLGLLLQRTFTWSFIDLFIMLIGLAFSFRLRQISRRIELASKLKVKDSRRWRVIRQDYIALVNLCETVNKHISTIIVISFMSNLYFVLNQLFNTLIRTEKTMKKIYLYLSFGFMLVRVVGVCFLGGAVHEEWKNVQFYLGNVGTLAYNSEVDRMIYHVTTWELSLSGKKFFRLSRELILNMAGATVTYILVLIQFYSNAIG